MSYTSIIPSNGWAYALYSSSLSNFTTGVSLISTRAEATFTIGASATTIVISSNRNTASRCLSGRAVRFAAVGAQRFPSADAEALTPTSGSPQKPDIGAQAVSGLVDPLPVADHPKPPPWKDKVELTIDSLQNYALLKPIGVIVEALGDKVFVAEAPELNVSTSGTSVGGALISLKDHISAIYEGSLIPLLPVRSTSCRDGAAARRRCQARIGMLRVGCAGG